MSKARANADATSQAYIENATTAQELSGTYTGGTERLYFNDLYTLTGNVTIQENAHLALGTIADKDVLVEANTGSTERTITGEGTLESGELLKSKETDLTGMTGELGSTVTGSPAITGVGTLTSGTIGSGVTFPAGHVLQVKHYEVTETNALTTSYVNYWENAITLKSASSDVFVTCIFNVWLWNGSSMGMKIYRKVGATVATSDTAVWTKNTVDGTGPLTIFFNPGGGEGSFAQTFSGQDVISGQDAGDTLYYGLFFRKRTSANVSVGNNYAEDGWMSMQLMEVQK